MSPITLRSLSDKFHRLLTEFVRQEYECFWACGLLYFLAVRMESEFYAWFYFKRSFHTLKKGLRATAGIINLVWPPFRLKFRHLILTLTFLLIHLIARGWLTIFCDQLLLLFFFLFYVVNSQQWDRVCCYQKQVDVGKRLAWPHVRYQPVILLFLW